MRSTLAAAVPAPKPTKRKLPLLPVEALLEAQRTMTAVERFAKQHDSGEFPAQAKYYRDLIPFVEPKAGEQYAFEVDLDACTGCKACVAACHTLNGLDEAEVWRTVGLLHGGNANASAQQTVTTSCHHCLEPACLEGCPVGAYEKDPITGIVKHLDDQCFGCQYCTLMCPYDAPKYNAEKGVVRKCDMCSDRLAHGEAPACVQACPNQAIAVRIVERAAVVEMADAHSFLPGAPAPEHTLPTTVYKTKKSLPSNMLPADFYRTRAEPSHPPLVVMLTLTQLAAGAIGLELLVERLAGAPVGDPFVHAAFACSAAVVGLLMSLMHLGRPWLAWRAVLGLRTSWLSREAVSFGLFVKLAVAYVVLLGGARLENFRGKALFLALAPAAQIAAALAGALGVFCSVMVYVATRRVHWSGTQTGGRFFGTALLLGAASLLTVSEFTTNAHTELGRAGPALCTLLMLVAVFKLCFELGNLRHLRERGHSALKRMALVMLRELKAWTALRFTALLAGGIVLPLWLVLHGFERGFGPPATAVALLLLLAGELSERVLFFSAAPASRMPGGIR